MKHLHKFDQLNEDQKYKELYGLNSYQKIGILIVIGLANLDTSNISNVSFSLTEYLGGEKLEIIIKDNTDKLIESAMTIFENIPYLKKWATSNGEKIIIK